MNKITGLLLILCSVFILSCGSSTNETSLFADLERSYKTDPSKENLNSLLKAYNGHIIESPNDVQVLEKAYALSSENKIPTAPSYLMGMIKNTDPGSKKSSDYLFQLATALESQGKESTANVIYGNLMSRFPAHSELATIKAKIGDTTPAMIIARLTESRLENPDQYGINRAEAFKYVDACEAFALSAPDHPSSPEHLFDAAEIAKLLKTYNKALELYDWLIEKYPNYSKTPSALFIKAFTLENELGRDEDAKAAYELFLEKYPNDNFADDAQFSLENIGKSPDEVLRAIEAKAKGNQ